MTCVSVLFPGTIVHWFGSWLLCPFWLYWFSRFLVFRWVGWGGRVSVHMFLLCFYWEFGDSCGGVFEHQVFLGCDAASQINRILNYKANTISCMQLPTVTISDPWRTQSQVTYRSCFWLVVCTVPDCSASFRHSSKICCHKQQTIPKVGKVTQER